MEKDKVNPLGTEPVGRLLRKFAIPSIISMLVTSLYIGDYSHSGKLFLSDIQSF